MDTEPSRCELALRAVQAAPADEHGEADPSDRPAEREQRARDGERDCGIEEPDGERQGEEAELVRCAPADAQRGKQVCDRQRGEPSRAGRPAAEGEPAGRGENQRVLGEQEGRSKAQPSSTNAQVVADRGRRSERAEGHEHGQSAQ